LEFSFRSRLIGDEQEKLMMKNIEKIRNINDLLEFISMGKKAKYLCFWGHTQDKNLAVSKSCFSQWYGSPFELDGVTYLTAEHFMMVEKARLFADRAENNNLLVEQIIKASHPQKAKQLGRQVEGFTNEVWNQHRFDIVVRGNLAKFSQNELLADYLLETDNRVLVEASPVDKVWGIGLAADDLDSINPYKWKGLNLLGFALMEVRAQLNAGKKA
jgi:ribA/ribD-fused uncharacterized protein